ESIVQKIQGGVVIHFEKSGPDPPPVDSTGDQATASFPIATAPTNSDSIPLIDNVDETSNNDSNETTKSGSEKFKNWHSCRKLIYVQRATFKGYSLGHWPIPESFWPDLNSPTLTPRSSHPYVKFTCINTDPMIIENL